MSPAPAAAGTDIESLLRSSSADDYTKADAWEAFHAATSRDDLTTRLQSLNLPDETKADMWEMFQAPVNKQSMAPGTFQTQPGGRTYNVNTLGITPLTPPPGISPGTASKARTQLSGFPQQVKEEEAGALPAVGAMVGSVGGPEGMALGAAAGELSKPLIRGGKADINAAGNEALMAAIFGKVAEGVGWLIGGRGASPEAAMKLYQRAVTPSGASAVEEAALKDDFQRAAKYIAPETRGVALQHEQGLLNASRVADDAAEKLWYQRVQPTLNRYGSVPSPGSPVANAIRSSITDTDRVTRPGVVRATEALADAWDRPMTVREQSEIVRHLNNEKSVMKFYSMSPADQAAAELGDPAIRGKVVGLNAMRSTMFDTVGRAGGPELQGNFMDARKDWGALKSVSGMLQDATSPAPVGKTDEVGRFIRATWRPDTWGRTLGIDNPNALAARSFNMLGRTELGPPPLFAPPPPQTAGALPAAQPPLITPLPGNLGPEASTVRGVAAQPQPMAENRMLPRGPLFTPPPPEAPPAGPPIAEGTRATRKGLMLPQQAGPEAGRIEPPSPAATTKVNQVPPPLEMPPGGPRLTETYPLAASRELERFGIPSQGVPAAKMRDIETAIRGPRYRSMAYDEKVDYLRKLIGSPGLRKPPS